jgi:hypothetical protein
LEIDNSDKLSELAKAALLGNQLNKTTENNKINPVNSFDLIFISYATSYATKKFTQEKFTSNCCH